MKVIFLDMDGVLNNAEWMKARDTDPDVKEEDRRWVGMIDPAAVEVLNEIVAKSGAKVVVSSTWRLIHPPADMQRFLEARGFKGEIIGSTPRSALRDCQRGDEIKRWLDQHEEVTEFVALDDDSDMGAVRDRWVRTYWQHWERYPEGPLGLHRGLVPRSLSLLNVSP